MNLRPSDIYFSHDSIHPFFDKRCLYSGYLIGQTLDDICEGRCSVSDIPTISVMLKNGKWFTADNRRLWVFRELERLGKCSAIPVVQTFYIPPQKFTTFNDGESVRVRGFPGGRCYQSFAFGNVSDFRLSTNSNGPDDETQGAVKVYCCIAVACLIALCLLFLTFFIW